MLNYKVNVSGCVCDTDTDFKCGFDIVVENGGSVGNVGMAVQDAINRMKDKGHPIEKSEAVENSTEKSAE